MCAIYVFYSICPYIELKSDASSALDVYAPSVSIGQPLPQGFSILDISNFLSHVLDSAAGGVKKNLGYIWNRIVDSGYCPATENHRHEFVYGLTSTSLTADLQQPQEGYYCYCNKCGQLAGSLIERYIEESHIDDDGNINLYQSATATGYSTIQVGIENYTIGQIFTYGVDFNYNYTAYGSGYVKYDDGIVTFDTSGYKRGYIALFGLFDVENIEVDISNIEAYLNISKIDFNNGAVSNYNPPLQLQNHWIGTVGDKYIIGVYTIRDGRKMDFYLSDNYLSSLKIQVNDEVLNNNYNYDNIQAPIAYVNNGTLIYGGYSSSIVDTDTMIYTDPSTGMEYEIDNLEYDYSTNTYTLDISDLLNDLTVKFGVDGISIDDGEQIKNYYYVTNPLTPVNPVTDVGTGTGLVNLDGTINLTVNQVSSNTNAYITTNEDIPQGLRGLRETLATMFVELPEMTGEFTDFMQTGFSYIPDEVITLVVFGVSIAVFVGIFKLFWR